MVRKFKPYVASEDLVKRFHNSYTGPQAGTHSADYWSPEDTESDLRHLTREEVGLRTFRCLATVCYREQADGRKRWYISRQGKLTEEASKKLREGFPRFSPDDTTLDALHQELSDYVERQRNLLNNQWVDAAWGSLEKCKNGTLYIKLKPYKEPPHPKRDVEVILP